VIVHSASSMLCLWLEHRRCALWLGLLELVSNGRFCHCEQAQRASVAINRISHSRTNDKTRPNDYANVFFISIT
ncbi:MAG: hypothetical protein K2N70_03890, partial [Helicobacter sp.]|nr:hypothetical protein [Helicobacter sp.]